MILVRQACGMGGELGSKMMGFEEKTALMTASKTATMFGSKVVLNYILETSCVDVNQACGLDGLMCVAVVDIAVSTEVLSSCLMLLHFILYILAYC